MWIPSNLLTWLSCASSISQKSSDPVSEPEPVPRSGPVPHSRPGPQKLYISPGVYRFVNLKTNTAVSLNDSLPNSTIVHKPIVDNDNAQLWHVVDTKGSLERALLNNGTGEVLTAIKENEPARARAVSLYGWTAVWAVEPHGWGDDIADPMAIDSFALLGGLDIDEADQTVPGTPVIVTQQRPEADNQGLHQTSKRLKSQMWYAQYVGV